MKRSKTWIRDAMQNGTMKYYTGQKVVVFRRKSSGYPKALKDDAVYRVKYTLLDDLVLIEDIDHEAHKFLKIQEYKVNKSYMIPIEYLRDELINQILNFDEEENTQINK
jgi:hypothetical protein